MSRMILYLAFIYVGHIVTWYIKRYMYLYLASFRTTGSVFLSLHNAIRSRGHSRHVALSSNPSMLIDKSKR